MEREPATREVIERFLGELGRRAKASGRIYIAGGAHMVLLGFRRRTEDIDYVAEVDDEGDLVAAIRSLIRDLNISVEPAGPGDFIPLPSGWESRSAFAARFGALDVFTFDPVSTALSKVERGSTRDIGDALRLLRDGIVQPADLEAAFEEIVSRLERESLRVDKADFQRKMQRFLNLVEERPTPWP